MSSDFEGMVLLILFNTAGERPETILILDNSLKTLTVKERFMITREKIQVQDLFVVFFTLLLL